MRAAEEFLKESENNAEELLLLLREAMKQVGYYRRLLEHLEVDTLTGLPSGNRFRELMAEIGNQAKGVGILFFDVNDLKVYNDTMGHKAGDLLLQKASESLLCVISKNAKAFRIGGDEFVMVLRDCTEAEIADILKKWREKLVELNALEDGIYCAMAVGYSIGSNTDNISQVLERADKHMYEEKKIMKAGRIR